MKSISLFTPAEKRITFRTRNEILDTRQGGAPCLSPACLSPSVTPYRTPASTFTTDRLNTACLKALLLIAPRRLRLVGLGEAITNAHCKARQQSRHQRDGPRVLGRTIPGWSNNARVAVGARASIDPAHRPRLRYRRVCIADCCSQILQASPPSLLRGRLLHLPHEILATRLDGGKECLGYLATAKDIGPWIDNTTCTLQTSASIMH